MALSSAPMRILIADDEPLARVRMRGLLAALGGDYRAVGEAATGAEALRLCRQGGVDLVLMDVQMPEMDGLEAARRLAGEPAAPAVVFVTAYDDYALEAFEGHAQDYLVKPVRLERLRQALERVRTPTRPQLQTLGAARAGSRGRISASFRGGCRSVPVADVLYFRAEQKYVVARYPGGTLLIEKSLKTLEQEFGQRFLRVHRNALVARDRFHGMEKAPDGRVLACLRGTDERLEISRRHLPAARKWLRQGAASPELELDAIDRD